MEKAKRVADDLRKCADILLGLADLLMEDVDASRPIGSATARGKAAALTPASPPRRES